MKVAVFGGTGLTGSLVIEAALQDDHQVVVLTRDASRLRQTSAPLTVVEGSPTSPADVRKALRRADVVIHCLGIGGRGEGTPSSLVSDSVKIALAAMQAERVGRIVCMSNTGAGDSGPWLYRRLVIPVFLSWLRPLIADKNVMEAALRASSVEWVAVRFPDIVPGPGLPVRTSTNGRGIGFRITADSAAAFLLRCATESQWLRQTPSCSN